MAELKSSTVFGNLEVTGSITENGAGVGLSAIVLGQGTTFPVSALFGQEFYRSDLDEWYKYNGTTWTQI